MRNDARGVIQPRVDRINDAGTRLRAPAALERFHTSGTAPPCRGFVEALKSNRMPEHDDPLSSANR
jgi:hypothetical protein